MTLRSYYVKMNSILGSVVPLAMLHITGGAPVSAREIDKASGQGVTEEKGAGAVKGAGEERNVEM